MAEQRAAQTPPGKLPPPAHLSPSPPVPEPAPADPTATETLSPTRYGDWERKGIAIDF
ncbi:DUF1674 domain-containing protein [Sphingomonas bacterium]|uniref:DUF1674 domain-containing protein n=1 Tax=Sphingomonas bacterium TaxID=1895847 RepID=UPI0015757C40|nr:DUF1674 domain-containing protein [Sphingomonas bacterium]